MNITDQPDSALTMSMQIIKADNLQARDRIDFISAGKNNAHQPWYHSIHEQLKSLRCDTDSNEAFNQSAMESGLINHQGLPIRFVEQSQLPHGVAYELFIGATGQVPTRDNAHDFFNALVWLSFPLIKRELNALQAGQIASAGVGQHRGSLRDAATLFDENAALLILREGAEGQVLMNLLKQREWLFLFVEHRETFLQNTETWLFGHALMEKLLNPYKAITTHVWPVVAPDQFFSLAHENKRGWLDKQVAQQLRQLGSELQPACFASLPVLGIPGWWPEQDRDFYLDKSVFRPRRV